MREYIVPIYDDSPDHDEIFVGYIRENARELVRCKDCKYWEHWKPITSIDTMHCTNMMYTFNFTNPEDFCMYGKRRADDERSQK